MAMHNFLRLFFGDMHHKDLFVKSGMTLPCICSFFFMACNFTSIRTLGMTVSRKVQKELRAEQLYVPRYFSGGSGRP